MLESYDSTIALRSNGNQALENTPEIKFECQEDKQLSNILELYFKISKVLGKSVPRNFHSDQVKLIQLPFSNLKCVPLRKFSANNIKVLEL